MISLAKPIQPGNYDAKKIYTSVKNSLYSCMGYCGFQTPRDMFRYLLSPAFPPVFVKYAIVMESERDWERQQPFKNFMKIIEARGISGQSDQFPASLEKAWELYHTHLQYEVQNGSRKASTNAVAEFLAYCLFWVVEEGPKELEKSYEELEERHSQQKKDVEGACGPIPDIDLKEGTVLLRSSGGVVLEHDNDLSSAERYHRAFQLLFMLWNHIKRKEGSTFADRWTNFWQQNIVFSYEKIDLQQYAPPWMRAGVADQ